MKSKQLFILSLVIPAFVCSAPARAHRTCSAGPDCGTLVAGDLDIDLKVDFSDLGILAFHWLTDNTAPALQHGVEHDPNYYSEVLKNMLTVGPHPHVPFRFYTPDTGWNPPGPGFSPIHQLNTTYAVPFLIDVLLNGPDWSEEEVLTAFGGIVPHVARCYAALCLGAVGDLRAFQPLVEILENGDYMEEKYTITYRRKDEHDIRRYAAFALGLLGDCRAVEPLIASLNEDKWVECIYALVRLRAFTAVPTIIDLASEYDLFCGSVHRCFEYMVKVDFNIEYSREDGIWAVEGLPVTSTGSYADILEKLWQHWVQAGNQYAKEHFDEYYPQWKAALRDKPGARSLHGGLQEKMLRGGVAVMPHVTSQIEQGDDRLIGVIGQLTSSRTAAYCTVSEYLRWWRENGHEWLIFDVSALATVLHVPADYPNIQAAIDDCNDGDVVRVAPGTYTGDGNRDIDFKGKAITVRSADPTDPNIVTDTVIDCNASEADRHRGFIFDSNEGPDSILDGLTITNGYAPEVMVRSYRYSFGGGILCKGASPVIRNCLIKDNTAGMRGGGILGFEEAGPQIIGCTVTGNTGGGIFDDSGRIINCTVTENSSFGVASMYGEVTGCTISHNKGVGLDCSWFIQPTVRNCIISHNQNGGVECFDSGGCLFNCIISGNRSSESGGGIRAVGEINSLVIENCVIVGNTTEGRGGAIICGTELGGGPLISSTIIAYNRSTAVAESGGYGGSNGDPSIQHCLFYDNAGGDFYDYDTDTTSTGAGQINAFDLASANIDGDPCFASLGYWDPNGTTEDANDDFWVDGDYHLKSQAGRWDPASQTWVKDDVTSLCIDAGNQDSPIGHEPFPNGGIINIGAYGGSSQASKSYFGVPACETVIAGDINGDCKVDYADFSLMALHWLEDNKP